MNTQGALIARSSWSSFLGCPAEYFDEPRTGIVLHNVSAREPISENEIYVLEWKNGWTIVSVSPRFADRVSTILGEHPSDIEGQLRAGADISKKYGPFITAYRADGLEVSWPSPDVRMLAASDATAYDAFMEACDEKGRKAVDMDFQNPFHAFFGHFENGNILSLGNYQRDDEADRIAHIGILTLPRARGRGCATGVIRNLLADALGRSLVPQWRVHVDNAASRKIAEEFGFVEALRTYSLVLSE